MEDTLHFTVFLGPSLVRNNTFTHKIHFERMKVPKKSVRRNASTHAFLPTRIYYLYSFVCDL